MKQLTPSQMKMTMVIVLAVFILTSLITSICLYVKAGTLSHDAKILNRAVAEASSIAETLKACDGKMQKTARMLKNHKISAVSNESLTFYYDENMEPSSEVSSSYTASVKKDRSGNCYLYNIYIYQNSDKTPIYELKFKDVKEKR